MDPTIVTAVISAVAALIGAVVGAGGTIITARGQHKRTIEFERKKEERAREQRAAENCRLKVERMAALTFHEQSHRDADDDSYVQRANEFRRLDEEAEAEALFLSPRAQGRIKLAREALSDANDIVNYGFYYHGVRSVTDRVTSDVNEAMAAVVRGVPIPERSKQMGYIAVALQKLDSQRNEEYAEEVHEHEERERRWLAENPEALPTQDTNGGLVRLRRRLARAIDPG